MQIHNVPLAFDNKECPLCWGKLLGLVEDVDVNGPIIRVQVQIDVTHNGIAPSICMWCVKNTIE